MILQHRLSPRRGTHVVECAVIYPVTFFFIFAIIFGAMGIFRYQEMATFAREATRYGSTHGAQYRKDAGQSIGTGGSSREAVGSTSPLDVSQSPYNASPWNTLIWFKCHPADAANTYPNEWADVIYDNAIRGKTFLLDSNKLQCWIGWSPVVYSNTSGSSGSGNPDNYPGSRVCCCMKYQAFPEGFIWWNPNATLMTVSTSAMPITN